MTKILNHINTYADLTAYDNDMEKDYPNVSYLVATDEVKWNKYDPDHIVCKYNVTSTSEATKLLLSTRNISKMWIDGVEQPSVVDSYTFDTLGEHIVKIGLSNKTTSNGCSFRFCNNIISAIIPSNVSWVYSYCFAQCENFASIIIQNGVKYIDNNAFYLDTKLTSITIPDSVTKIGNEAFSSCSSLTDVTIGSGVTSIGEWAFSGCTGLTSIVVDSANTAYDSRNNCNAIIKTSTNELIAGCKNTVIPNTVTSIGRNAFGGCSGLTSINIPDSVTSIGNQAFQNCRGLTSITIQATTPPSLANANAFNNTSTNLIIYVPAASVNAYKTATNWSTYADRIQPIPTE